MMESQESSAKASAHRLKKIGEAILNLLDRIETGEAPNVSIQVLYLKLFDLSVRLSPLGEDILKSLAHHLANVQTVKDKQIIQFMRSLIQDLFELYQVDKSPFVIKKQLRRKEEPKFSFISGRMNQASIGLDLGNFQKNKHKHKHKGGFTLGGRSR